MSMSSEVLCFVLLCDRSTCFSPGDPGSLLPYPPRPFQEHSLASSENTDSTPEHDNSLSPSSQNYYVEVLLRAVFPQPSVPVGQCDCTPRYEPSVAPHNPPFLSKQHNSDAGSSVSLLDMEDHQLHDNALLGNSLYIGEPFQFHPEQQQSMKFNSNVQRHDPVQRMLRQVEPAHTVPARGMMQQMQHNMLQSQMLPTSSLPPHNQLPINWLQLASLALLGGMHTQPGMEGTSANKAGHKRPSTCQLQEENETKRMKRLLKNQQSAVQSRARKKEYINSLETKVKTLTDQVQSIKQQLDVVMQVCSRSFHIMNFGCCDAYYTSSS